MNGIIFNIQRFSITDGPGIRTTIFLKGCSLKCKWCHNPEGLIKDIQVQYLYGKCINCNLCDCNNKEKMKNILNQKVDECVKEKVNICPAKALKLCGEELTSDQLIERILKDKSYYHDRGGVTFSGGEPLLQADFIYETAKKLKEIHNVSVAVDTAGNVSFEQFEKIIDVTDLFLYDIKAYDENLHIKGTGCSNKLILENLSKLDKLNKKIWIRIPVIGGFNDSLEEMEKIADFVSKLKNVERLTLIPFHKLGNEKYVSLNYEQTMLEWKEIEEQKMREIERVFKVKGENYELH